MKRNQLLTMGVLPVMAFLSLCFGFIFLAPASNVWAKTVTVKSDVLAAEPVRQGESYAAVSIRSDIQVMAPAPSMTITPAEADLLARLVRAEAQGEPYEGKVAVAAVVLNRVKSHLFPDKIYDVIYQARQFQPVDNGTINLPADEESKRAVADAIAGADPTYGALYFFAPRKVHSPFLSSLPLRVDIGGHRFLGAPAVQ